jgi:hypothetical protein
MFMLPIAPLLSSSSARIPDVSNSHDAPVQPPPVPSGPLPLSGTWHRTVRFVSRALLPHRALLPQGSIALGDRAGKRRGGDARPKLYEFWRECEAGVETELPPLAGASEVAAAAARAAFFLARMAASLSLSAI